jgi:peptidoglycan hydrolase-like protein with peptidoglycan-binding domain
MALQQKGKDDGIYDDVIDGKFGPKTLETAKHYGFKE